MSTSALDAIVVADTLLADVEATRRLAEKIAGRAAQGDVITLSGDLGSGKTTFARFFIWARVIDVEVPSPTFTLVQVYPCVPVAIWHFDLYRIAAPPEAFELGIEEAFADGISLIEWPDRLGDLLPVPPLDVELSFIEGDENVRRVRLSGDGAWQKRLDTLNLEWRTQ
ncbi:MAG: tRNA (adenosine(37)-N6)-threonylcarbamoyltransferase complex ATPase subunit type 1 TsaE [Proteobacteria bacterium]|nr:tRNA (adenosine(37)-N6)-threonylcarbamoyltransferase complex ATPase subunit type 1 TsaE [Pseudomonadota bacterium]